jgi:hypothetical protein
MAFHFDHWEIYDFGLSPQKPKKKVHYSNTCSVILIPTRDEYFKAGIDLWYHRDELDFGTEEHDDSPEKDANKKKENGQLTEQINSQFMDTEDSNNNTTTEVEKLEDEEAPIIIKHHRDSIEIANTRELAQHLHSSSSVLEMMEDVNSDSAESKILSTTVFRPFQTTSSNIEEDMLFQRN